MDEGVSFFARVRRKNRERLSFFPRVRRKNHELLSLLATILTGFDFPLESPFVS